MVVMSVGNGSMPMRWVEPGRCVVNVSDGALENCNGRYEKRLADLSGLYANQMAFDSLLRESGNPVVYSVEDYRLSSKPGDLIFGLTSMAPGYVGDEFFLTRGHIHAEADRPEIYYGQNGDGLMLMESPDGESRIVEIRPRTICYVPPFWIHRSVNVGHENFVMTFVYPADSGQDYEIIARSGGMKQRIVRTESSGWKAVPNENYRPRTADAVQRISKGVA
jgi:glucose-6-phosphate isomerase